MSGSLSITVLGSGSSGNGSVIRSDETTILVDSGFSMKEIVHRMQLQGISPNSIDAIVISHYHSDHIRSAAMLTKRYNIPIYCTEETFPYLAKKTRLYSNLHIFREPFTIKQITIFPVPVDHDAHGTVAFHIQSNGKGLTVATDLGHVNHELVPYLQKSHLWLLESNHDSYMLKNGPYPLDLKIRIASKFGHLSNDQAIDAILNYVSPENKTIILGHLSKENNSPSLLLEQLHEKVGSYLRDRQLFIASQEGPLPTIEL